MGFSGYKTIETMVPLVFAFIGIEYGVNAGFFLSTSNSGVSSVRPKKGTGFPKKKRISEFWETVGLNRPTIYDDFYALCHIFHF